MGRKFNDNRKRIFNWKDSKKNLYQNVVEKKKKFFFKVTAIYKRVQEKEILKKRQIRK